MYEADATPVETEPKQVKDLSTRFQPGQSGNITGRPIGARTKLAENFVQDMYSAWQTRGRAAIDTVIDERPHEFIKAVASLMPKEVTIRTEIVQELSDDELTAALFALRSVGALAHSGAGRDEATEH